MKMEHFGIQAFFRMEKLVVSRASARYTIINADVTILNIFRTTEKVMLFGIDYQKIFYIISGRIDKLQKKGLPNPQLPL